MNQQQIDTIYELLEELVIFFNNLGINYNIICGSALGQARNGGFIPWDNDIDFGIHQKDADLVWKNKEQLEKQGYHILKADIGFKLGTGNINSNSTINNENMVIGPISPFLETNQDIFFLSEDGYAEDGTSVMRYTAERARNSWPKEIIPVSGWYNPVIGLFGGYEVNILPKKELNWYLTHAYGTQWKTHDADDEKILDFSCLLHSSKKF